MLTSKHATHFMLRLPLVRKVVQGKFQEYSTRVKRQTGIIEDGRLSFGINCCINKTNNKIDSGQILVIAGAGPKDETRKLTYLPNRS